jgi:hypothetical protein
MRRSPPLWALATAGAAMLGAACDDAPTIGVCTDTYTPIEDEQPCGCANDGVDLLIVVDDSASMGAAQTKLAEALYAFVPAFTEVDDGSLLDPVSSMRIAVVTSDLGLAFGEDLALVPGDDIPAGLASCSGSGDDGAFRQIEVSAVEIDGASIPCPALDGAWAESDPYSEPNPDLAAQAACLAQQGVAGCALRQPLAAAARALERDDQWSFATDSHVLVVLVVTDADDCSLEDAPALLATGELEDAGAADLACAAHPELLRDIDGPEGRLPQMAETFGESGTASSVGDSDFGPAMERITAAIRAKGVGDTAWCLDRPLEWDPERRVPSECELVAEFTNPDGDDCPFDLAEGDEATAETVEASDGTWTNVYCPLPELPVALDCDDNAAFPKDAVGWFYCENRGEEVDAAPDDGSRVCPYVVEITPASMPLLLGAPVTMRCVNHGDCEDGGANP